MITIGTRTFTPPASWNELSTEQALTVYLLLTGTRESAVLPAAEVEPLQRIEIAKYLLGLDPDTLQAWEHDAIANGEGTTEENRLVFAEELDQVCRQATAFLFHAPAEGEEDRRPAPALTLTRNPYPTISYRDAHNRQRQWYGPANGLENLTIYELSAAFTYFESYLKDQDPDQALRLLALLWRPGKPATKKLRAQAYGGDRRLPYLDYEATVELRVPHVRRIPPLVRNLLLFWFASCRQTIIGAYPNIFDADQPDSPHLERVGNDYGWGGLLLSLAGGIVHLRQIADQAWQNAFTYLSFLEDQRKLAERQAARQRKGVLSRGTGGG